MIKLFLVLILLYFLRASTVFTFLLIMRPRIFDQFKEIKIWFAQTEVWVVPCVEDVWFDFAYGKQVHSTTLLSAVTAWGVGDGDALMSNQRGLWVAVYVADCVSVLIYVHDEKKPCVVAIHSGWRGTAWNDWRWIVCVVVDELLARWYSLSDFFVWLWPSICQNCYEFWDEAYDFFDEKYIKKRKSDGKCLLDVRWCVRDQLLWAWVLLSQIEISDICSFEDGRCFSYRRDGKWAGRMWFGVSLF